ncbi:acyltransferase family protein [Halomonas cerina]|uniref:Peptidoglycan/LPS O-acetylase OafA/YrhL n=1 Tax=Halomonas cerina TaxID=447424 RepID=A0A839VJ24_9GAMM|nr:acyltransferase family protein [Halomonas cerina]MBB3192584.1 peptidoglycan/LPS O-acetylase OafA/YrhL [Halomonas cerina]
MHYRREIDGLRAVAVLPVILFHAGFSWFSGGFVGVDVFFVISGYLITSLLLDDLKKGTFSIARFYERRARRILPALVAVLLGCLPFAWLWLTPAQLQDFSQGLVAISLFASNVLFWLKTHYFAPSAEENPLLHTWSLAIEEQFYIVFPLLLLFLWRHAYRHMLTAILVLSALSLLAAEWGWRQAPSANFFLLPTRAWELGAGVACAFLLNRRPQWSSAPLATLGLGCILFAVLTFDETVPFPSLYTLLPVGGAVLVTLFATPATLTGRVLAMPLLVGIGLISFSAYLWHQPLFAFARLRSLSDPSWAVMALLSLAALALAYLTWRYVEQPFRRKPIPLLLSRQAVFRASGVAGMVMLAAGLYGHMAEGVPGRIAPSGSPFLAIDVDNRIRFNPGLSEACEDGFLPESCRTGQDPEIMLWGDSYAMHLASAITASPSLQDMSLVQFTKPVCAPIYGLALTSHRYPLSWSRECIAFNAQVKAWMEQHPSVKYVVMSSPLGVLYHDAYQANGKLHEHPHGTELVVEHLNRTAEAIRQAGKIPIFVSPPPRSDENLARCIIASMIFVKGNTVNCNFRTEQFSPHYVKARDLLASERITFPVVNLEPYICHDGLCHTFMDGKVVYRDEGHLSREGSEVLGVKHDLLGDILRKAQGEDADRHVLAQADTQGPPS